MPKTRYSLTAEIDRVQAKHPDIQIVLPVIYGEPETDGGDRPVLFAEKVALVPPPQRFSDDVVMFASEDPVRAASLLLGGDYEQFRAGGGSATLLFQILEDSARAKLGES